jgi:hypothetical protein
MSKLEEDYCKTAAGIIQLYETRFKDKTKPKPAITKPKYRIREELPSELQTRRTCVRNKTKGICTSNCATCALYKRGQSIKKRKRKKRTYKRTFQKKLTKTPGIVNRVQKFLNQTNAESPNPEVNDTLTKSEAPEMGKEIMAPILIGTPGKALKGNRCTKNSIFGVYMCQCRDCKIQANMQDELHALPNFNLDNCMCKYTLTNCMYECTKNDMFGVYLCKCCNCKVKTKMPL